MCLEDTCWPLCDDLVSCPNGMECSEGVCRVGGKGESVDVLDQRSVVDVRGEAKQDHTLKPDDTIEMKPDPEVHYPATALLEFVDPKGDDDLACEGFQDPPENTQKIDHCNFELSYNQKRTFEVVYLEDSMPVPSQEIAWELINVEEEDGNPMATIDTISSGTNPDGIASVNVTSKDLMGQFALRATAISTKFTIPPLYFDIVIVPKQEEPLIVKFKYEGAAMFDVVKAYLFLQDDGGMPGCSLIDPNSPPMADKASPEFNNMLQSWKISALPNFGPEEPLHFTVLATAYKAGGPVLASGCNEEDAVVEFGKSTVVTVALHDVPPKYKGKFEVVNHFDLLSALPDNVEMVVNVVLDFFNSPATGIMQLSCICADSDAQDMCETFFKDPDNPDPNDLTMAGDISANMINAILLSMLEENIGEDVLFTGKDVGNMLRDIDIYSTATLKAEPDQTGAIVAADTEVEWHTLSFQWTIGEDCNPQDPDCGLKSFSFNAIGQDVITTAFDAHIDGYGQGQFDKLVIDTHAVNFKYGAFVNFTIEKLLLPMLLGDGSDGLPVVDSYEKFFGAMMGGKECLIMNTCCDVYAQNVSGQAGGWMEGLLKTGCSALIACGADYLRTLLVGLDADEGESFTLETKAGQPCTLYDTSSDQTIDAFGKPEPPELRCAWDVLLKLAGTEVAFDAEFWGVRQQ